MAELEADPEVAYAAPNTGRARLAFDLERPRAQRRSSSDWTEDAVELLRPQRHRRPRRVGHRERRRRTGRQGRDGRRARHRRRLQEPRALPPRSRPSPASSSSRGYDFVDGDRFPNDQNGHGTHVAGTIAEATNNGKGVTGLAYGAKIMPVRVLDENGEGDAVGIGRAIRLGRQARGRGDQPEPRVRRLGDRPDRCPASSRAIAVREQRRGDHRRRGRQPGRLARSPTRPARAMRSRSARPPSTAARPTTRTAARASTSSPPAAGTTPPTPTTPATAVLPPGRHRPRHLPADLRRAARGNSGCRTATRAPRWPRRTCRPRRAADRDAGGWARTRNPRRVASALQLTARDLGPDGFDPRYGHGLIDAPQLALAALGSPDDHHAARGVMGHLVRDPAEQEALRAGHALVADHDQVGTRSPRRRRGSRRRDRPRAA